MCNTKNNHFVVVVHSTSCIDFSWLGDDLFEVLDDHERLICFYSYPKGDNIYNLVFKIDSDNVAWIIPFISSRLRNTNEYIIDWNQK